MVRMRLQCDGLVVHCMDYRLQGYLNAWLEEHFPALGYDRVSIAGGVYDLDYVIGQVGLAVRLHEIKKLVLVNHENCGAYGANENYERHKRDLGEAKHQIESLYPDLDVETYYLHLNGTFERMSISN